MASERIENILLSVNDKVQRLMEADRFYVALYDPVRESLEFPLVVDDGDQIETGQTPWTVRPYQGRALLLDRVIDQEAQLFFEYALGEKLAEEGMEYWPDDEPPLSWLGVPMTFEGQVVGVLVAENRHKPRAFGKSGVRVLSTIARQTAMAIQNIRLYERLDRKVANLEAANEMGRQLTSGIRLSEPDILRLIYQQASQLMDTNNMYIALYEEATDTVQFELMYVNGKPKSVEPRAGGHGRTEWIIHNKKHIFITTKVESKAWYKQAGRTEYIGQPFASWIGVPMIAGQGKVMGVIATYHTAKEYLYDQDDLEVLSLMAGQAAVAIENARLYKEALELQDEVIAIKQLATLGTAIAALQHRINNTFNIIVPNMTRLRKHVDVTDETVVEILDIIERNARYTSDIIARIQEHLREGEKQEVNINAVLDEVVGVATEQWAEVVVTLDLDDSLPLIRVPIGQVSEVFRNLADNACRAMKGTGQLVVTSCLGNNIVSVRVQDTGPGIPPRVQERLFNKPVPSKEPGGGAGLGLWLSQLMLQTIGGGVKIDKSDSDGTTMLVQIPVPGTGKKEVRL